MGESEPGKNRPWSMDRALLEAVLAEVPALVFILDAEGRVLEANAAAGQALGMAREEMVGRPCREVEACAQGHLHEERCPIETAVETGRRAEAMYSKVGEDGRTNHYRVVTVPVPGGPEAAARVVRIRQDITAHAARERSLRLSDKLSAIGELSNYIAHEIRNPLFTIGGFADALLRSEGLQESDRSKVRIIREESRRLDNILRSILNFARPISAEAVPVDVNGVVCSAADLMAKAAAKAGVDLVLDLDKAAPMVRGESELLKQCLINMLKNSLEAMPHGGTLRASTTPAGNFVDVAVRDTGLGIPRDRLAQVFNPFYSTKDRGAGLGLAMTKKIVEDFGGAVSIDSLPGQGTVVTMHLLPVLAVDGAGVRA